MMGGFLRGAVFGCTAAMSIGITIFRVKRWIFVSGEGDSRGV